MEYPRSFVHSEEYQQVLIRNRADSVSREELSSLQREMIEDAEAQAKYEEAHKPIPSDIPGYAELSSIGFQTINQLEACAEAELASVERIGVSLAAQIKQYLAESKPH